MSDHPAYCFYKVFEPEAAKTISFERHYLLYAAVGSMRLEAGEKEWVLPPSRAAWLRADTPITMSYSAPITCCSVLFSPEAFTAPEEECRVFNMNALARNMILACRNWGPESSQHPLLATSMFSTLALLCQALAEQPANTWLPTGTSPAFRRALRFTEANLASEISLKDVAQAACISERTLARRFAEEAGMTWRQVQRRMRMIRAMELLADHHIPITDISLDVGYRAQSAFNAAFKAFTGQSPSAYRRGDGK